MYPASILALRYLRMSHARTESAFFRPSPVSLLFLAARAVAATHRRKMEGMPESCRDAVERMRGDRRVAWDEALETGDVSIMFWLRPSVREWSNLVTAQLADLGLLPELRWAHANGCPWDEATCAAAASGGHLGILKWALENGCPWDEETCRSAARAGHLDVLVWARANGCPWDENACCAAVQNGHGHVLAWMRENDCPLRSGSWQWMEDLCANNAVVMRHYY